ncbi:hypothetical protein LOTGIDRAFT_163162 [Lottia gigantea]|uniref:Uncharacterized protein n=1 Tax=Lottia gigantea TaxID=225164 RepID=V4A508_LOTGI|nr:hypothetical protein LOTGIDRAFT_163162 [Lottia gigantea]ESO91802.1 hypothetical protein LOTGIDRAFT_163162 [Lottia gigantea]
MLPNYNNHWQEARHRNTNRQPNQYHVPYNGPVFHRPLPPTNRRPPTNPSSYIPPHRRPTHNTYQSRGNHRPDQQQKRLPAHRRQPVPTHKEEEPFVKVFFQVLQCLHHLAILTLQQQGQPAFTFKRKVSELDSFIRPAMKTSAVDANIRSLNRTWLSKVTQVLIDHYQNTLQEKLSTIRTKSLSSPAVDRIVSHALSWARRSYGKRLTQAVITKFYQTINETKTRVTISLPTEMDTTPAPSRATTLPNQTPKRARSSPNPSPADIGKRSRREGTPLLFSLSDSSSPSTPSESSPRDPGSANLSSFCAFLDQQTTPQSPSKSRRVSRPSPPRTRSQSVPNATILTTTKPVPITPSTTIISATKPYYHQTKDKSLWKLPALKKSTSIIGSSNLNRNTKTSSDTEIHSYPGAQIHHIQSILESYDHDPKPTTIILHIRIRTEENPISTPLILISK